MNLWGRGTGLTVLLPPHCGLIPYYRTPRGVSLLLWSVAVVYLWAWDLVLISVSKKASWFSGSVLCSLCNEWSRASETHSYSLPQIQCGDHDAVDQQDHVQGVAEFGIVQHGRLCLSERKYSVLHLYTEYVWLCQWQLRFCVITTEGKKKNPSKLNLTSCR